MREMKYSGIEWIGEVPKNKRIIRNKYLLEYIKGKLPTDTNFESAGFPYIGATDLDSHEPCKTYTCDETLPDACDSDLLVLWDGARAGLCGTHKVGKVSSTIVRIREVDSTIYRPFLYWYYKGFEDYMYQRVNGTTIPHMNRKYIEEIQMIDWTAQEQQHISDYLDRKCSQIDAIIAKQQEVIEKLKAYKLSVITETVTKGLNPNVPMKDSGVEWIGKIPEHWETASISRVATVVRGASPRPAGDPRYFNGQDVPWITVAEVTKDDGKYITSTESYLTEEGAKYSRLVEKGTLVLSNSGATLGVPKVTLITGCINDGSVAFFDLKVEQMYLLYVFKSRTLELRKQMQGYGQPNLNTSIIKSIVIPLPHPEEQKSICEYLDKRCKAVDDTIKIKEKVVDRLSEYKKSLIYEVVTGKKEV